MKPFQKLAGLLLIWVAIGCAATNESIRPASTTTLPYRLIPSADEVLQPNEVHQYDVYWHILKIGSIVFQVEERPSTSPEVLIVTSRAEAKGAVGGLAQFGGNSRTTMAPMTFLPSTYLWDNGNPSSIKRRYIEFYPQDGLARGLEIGPDWWTPRVHKVTLAHDPLSVLMLLRVIDLDLGNEVRLDLIDGHLHRLCRITAIRDEDAQTPGGETVKARRYGFRVDSLKDGKLTDAPPETDMQSLVSLGPSRILLGTKGQMKGKAVAIRLVEYRSGRP